MKKSILLPVLAILLAAAVLFCAALGLNGVASANAQKAHIQMLRTLLPGSENFTVEAYDGEDANIRSVHKAENGFVIETSVYGYAGDITMLVGVSNEGRVTGLWVKELSETFGLGANALNDHVFLAQFLNTAGDVAIGTAGADAFSGATSEAAAEAEGEAEVYVDAITGATVTSKAIARSVNSAVAYVTGADVASAATSWGG